MARPLATLLKEAAQIKNSDMLDQKQKAYALSMLKTEIDAATGQGSLPGLAQPGAGEGTGHANDQTPQAGTPGLEGKVTRK